MLGLFGRDYSYFCVIVTSLHSTGFDTTNGLCPLAITTNLSGNIYFKIYTSYSF